MLISKCVLAALRMREKRRRSLFTSKFFKTKKSRRRRQSRRKIYENKKEEEIKKPTRLSYLNYLNLLCFVLLSLRQRDDSLLHCYIRFLFSLFLALSLARTLASALASKLAQSCIVYNIHYTYIYQINKSII